MRGLLVGALLSAASGSGMGQEPPAAKTPEAVLRAAQVQGSTRVIVELRVAWSPEGRLATLAQDSQRLDIGRAQRAVFGALTGTGANLVRNFETIPFQALEVTPSALAMLEADPRVVAIEPDNLYKPLLAQSAPLVQADQAWAVGVTGTGQMVVILDTGVDKAHSFLGGRVAAEACFSGNGNCPNGQTQQFGSGAGVYCSYDPSACEHGTHVAGIAAGSGSSFSGIAKNSDIMAVQVFSRFTGANCAGGPDPCALSYVSDQIAALQYVYGQRGNYSIASVNMSLGGGLFSTNCDASEAATKAAIDNLRSVGIATVIASGNDGKGNQISAPACISSAISVGSTTKSDTISSFSNSASILKLLAPGSSINSSVPGGGFAVFSGTSMATPHVTGAWAILKQFQPNASVDQILNALASTGLGIADSRNGLTKPRIRIKNAMDSLGVPAALTSPLPGTTFSGTSATFNWNTGTNVTSYWLDVGTTPGGNQINAGPETTSRTQTVTGLPTNGSTVYVRLWSKIGGLWASHYRDYTYAAVSRPNLSVNDVSLTEGTGGSVNAVFTVTLSGATAQTVTVSYATANGTATAGSDYTATSGTLTFTGPSSKTVSVPVSPDTVPEVTETFFLNLSNPVNADLTDGQGQATIVDDDVTISVSTTSAFTGQQVQVTVNGPGAPRDWVGLLSTGSPDAGPLLDWRYLNGTRTPPAAGLTTATLAFNMPSTAGTYNFRLYGNDTFVTMAVSAAVTVTINPNPVMDVSPASLSFGTVTVGSTKDLTVTVKNSGGGTLTGAGSVSGPGYSLVGNASYSLATNQTAVLTVRLAPGVAGVANGSLSLTGAGGATVALSGNSVNPPSVTAGVTTANPGQSIQVTAADGPGNPLDWVGLYSTSGVDAGGQLDWKYLNGTRTAPATGLTGGMLTFTLPTTPGNYNFRFFQNNGYAKLATSQTVVVQDVPVLQVTPTSLAFGSVTIGSSKDLTVSVKNAGGGTLVGNGTVAGAGFGLVGSGSYSLGPSQTQVLTVRFSPSGPGGSSGTLTLTGGAGSSVPLTGTGASGPTLSVDRMTVPPGGTVLVTVTNGPGNATDWIGLHATSAPDTTYSDWKYLNGTRTAPGTGLTGATIAFIMPTTLGTYNLRLFQSNGFVKLATSPTVTVQATSVTVSTVTATPGQVIQVTVANGPGNPTDWIGLYAVNAADMGGFLDWKYLNGSRTAPIGGVSGATVNFTLPLTPGTYNFRFFQNNGYTKLATSPTVTVQ